MGNYMYPLPHRPTFPVYGLSSRFVGLRWLVIWQNRQQLYSVTLGHGEPAQPPDAEWIAVETCLKSAHVETAPGVMGGPTGLTDAATGAVMRMAELTWSRNELRETNALVEELNDVASDEGTDAAFSRWTDEVVTVDGVRHQARRRETKRAWAVVVDLPTVALGISGRSAHAETSTELVSVRDRLDEYV